jgi:hypothetical protein
VIVRFVDLGGIDDFHQDQQNEQSPLNSNVHQFHQDQQIKQSPLNSNVHQFHQDQQNKQSLGDCSLG